MKQYSLLLVLPFLLIISTYGFSQESQRKDLTREIYQKEYEDLENFIRSQPEQIKPADEWFKLIRSYSKERMREIKFKLISIGMTKREVEELVLVPDKIKATSLKKGVFECWAWEKDKYALTFLNGKVVMLGNSYCPNGLFP